MAHVHIHQSLDNIFFLFADLFFPSKFDMNMIREARIIPYFLIAPHLLSEHQNSSLNRKKSLPLSQYWTLTSPDASLLISCIFPIFFLIFLAWSNTYRNLFSPPDHPSYSPPPLSLSSPCHFFPHCVVDLEVALSCSRPISVHLFM